VTNTILDGIPFLVAIGLLGSSIRYYRRGSARLNERDALIELPTRSIAEITEGSVELSGIPATSRAVSSPLQGLDRIAFAYSIEHYLTRKPVANPVYSGGDQTARLRAIAATQDKQRDLPNRKAGWVTVAQGTSSTLFSITDRSGTAVVEPSGAEIATSHRYEYVSDAPDGSKFLPDPLRDFVLKHGIEMNAMTRFREWVVQPGKELFVLGIARKTLHKMDAEYSVSTADEAHLLISDMSRTVIRKSLGKDGWQKTITGIAFFLAGAASLILGVVWRLSP